MRAALVLALVPALLAPASALACAMPHFEEKQLARVMEDIDAAATVPVAEATPAAPTAPVAPVAPAAPAADAKAAPAAPPTAIAEVSAKKGS